MGIVNFLISLNYIIITPIITKSISSEEYGIWTNFLATVGLLLIFSALDLPSALVRFSAGEKDKEVLKENFYCVFFITLFVSLILSLIISFKPIFDYLYGCNYDLLKFIYPLVIIYPLNNVALSFFRALNQIQKYSLLIFFNNVLYVIFIYFTLSNYPGIAGAIWGYLLAKSTMFLILMYLVYSMIGFKLPTFKNAKTYFKFSYPLVLSNTLNWITHSSDCYIIRSFLDMNFAGYYSGGSVLGAKIFYLIAPFDYVLPTVFSEYYNNNKKDETNKILLFSLKYFLLLAVPLVFILSMLSYPILIKLTTPDIASHGYLITPFIALSMLFTGSTSIINNILFVNSKLKFSFIIMSFAAILKLGTSFILVPLMGIIGLAIANLLASILIFVLTSIIASKYITGKFRTTASRLDIL
jgi:O-antigen/teichoic acid export membrane protein